MKGEGIVQAENELKGTKEVFSAAVLSTFFVVQGLHDIVHLLVEPIIICT